MSVASPRRLRLTVRLKLLLLLTFVLTLAMTTYLALAIHLVTEDRLAYAFDLNQRTAATLSSQVRASMESMAQRLDLFATLVLRTDDDGARQNLARALLTTDTDLVRVRLYRRGGDGRWVGSTEQTSWERLQPLEVTPTDLEDLERLAPIPFVLLDRDSLVVLNRSLLPAAQLLTVVVSERHEPGGRASWVVCADLMPNRLQAMFSGFALYRAYLVDTDGVALLHPDTDKVLAHANLASVPVVRAALDQPLARSGALEFTSSTHQRQIGAFAQVGAARLTVLVETERALALATTRRLVRLSWLFGIAILLVALLASLFFSRMLTTPLQRLRAATSELARGNYDVPIDVHASDEIGDLAQSFRIMAAEIREGQQKLIKSEKMAAFGQLGAGITHEVKNPLASIRGFAQLALHYFDDKAQVRESLEMVESEADRCLTILQNFLAFAHHDASKRVRLEVNDLVAHGVKLVTHQVRISGTKLHQSYEAKAQIAVIPGQLQQVLLNLLLNAQQALVKNGNIWVTTRDASDGEHVEIEIRDDGPGLSDEAMLRITQPFFTTKEMGTGLGLSVSVDIVRAHGGEMVIHSKVGEGAVFCVRLPVAKEDVASASPAIIEM